MKHVKWFLMAPIYFVGSVLVCSPAFAKGSGSHSGGGSHANAGGVHNVKSYTTRGGTHVEGHRQTNPDGTKNNNWSTKGNVNPDTGKAGTKPAGK